MSDLAKIQESLTKLFHKENARIIFWHDPDREFEILLSTLALPDITTIKLDQESSLQVKLRLEREEPNGKFLLYSAREEPEYDSDWLLDIRLYSKTFRADRASILLQELGLMQQSLKSHLALRRKFFDSKDRVARLKNLVQPQDSAIDLDRKMIAVITKADQPELFHFIRIFFHGWMDFPTLDLEEQTPPAWEMMEKMELDEPFWEMIESSFGYREDSPSLKNFLIRLMLTDFAHHLRGEVPPGLRSLLLPEKGWQNCVVCLAQWRDSSTRGTSYDRLSAEVADIIHLENHLQALGAEDLAQIHTFLKVEKTIAQSVRDLILESVESIQIEPIRSIISLRQAGHWATDSLADNPHAPRSAFHAVYEALLCAAEFLLLWQQRRNNMQFKSALELYQTYESELYKFDQLYRHLCEAAVIAEAKTWDITKSLRLEIENHYVNGYLGELALAWGRFLEPADGLLSFWNLSPVPNQHQFYEQNVASWVESGDNRRAFVIISDAFRYEAAQELRMVMNGKYRMEATLTSQLGVLPSYTALGMASLLPHKTLKYQGTDVLVDGRSSASTNRSQILETVEGIAIKASELLAMKKDEGREFCKNKRVVYIYQDIVDALGDDSKTESQTFMGVRKAIDELVSLISHITNNLGSYYVVVTADHGFLYSESQPGTTDKTTLEEKPTSAILAKKRYILGTKLQPQGMAWKGTVRKTANADDDLEFLIPKGTNLFHFVGGARFVHGGAMPQEICVPVLTIKQVRKAETKSKPVMVEILGRDHRITTGVCRFDLMQREPVGERLLPNTVKIGIYEGEHPVSNIQTVIFDSTSGNIDERKKCVTLTLTGKSFDKKKTYRLVMKNAESGIEQQAVNVIIDRMVSDEF